jgi:hypothetical protein
MPTFRYFPPSQEEQRGFVFQLVGTVISLAVAATLAARTAEAGLRGLMIGLGMGVLFLLARTMVQLEMKAHRAQNAEIEVDESGLKITDAQNKTQAVAWGEIESTEIVNGKLALKWRGGELNLSTREVENGMELIRLIATRGKNSDPTKTSNFIPLEPK